MRDGRRRRAVRRRLHPAGISRPALILLAICLALFVTANTTGSGWLLVIVSLLAGLWCIGFGAPALALRGVRVAVRAPGDAVAGMPVDVDVTLRGGPADVKLRLLEGRDTSAWVAARAPASGNVTLTFPRRGPVGALCCEIRCAAPLGLVWWRRVEALPLRPVLAVAPPPAEIALDVTGAGCDGTERLGGAAADGGAVVRGVREYTPGDTWRRVHWPSTARTGDLRVKELDADERPAVVVVLELCGLDDAADEMAASRAAGVVQALLGTGTSLTLSTCAEDGPELGPVHSTVDAGRRLAFAVPGMPAPAGADPRDVVEVRPG